MAGLKVYRLSGRLMAGLTIKLVAVDQLLPFGACIAD
jgi:hypothetical protein